MAKKAAAATAVAKSVPNLFNKAASAQKPVAAKKKDKGTELELPILMSTNPADVEHHRRMTPECARLHDAITTIHEQSVIVKSAEGKMNTAKGVVLPSAIDLLMGLWAKASVMPDSPIKVVNDKGEQVTLVVQDRCKSTVLSDEQIEHLTEILGDDAQELVVEKTEFALDSDVLAEDGVGEALSEAIQSVLTEDQAARLLTAKTVKRLAPGAIDRLAQVGNKNPEQMKMVFEAFGSSCVKYVKP